MQFKTSEVANYMWSPMNFVLQQQLPQKSTNPRSFRRATTFSDETRTVPLAQPEMQEQKLQTIPLRQQEAQIQRIQRLNQELPHRQETTIYPIINQS